MTFLFLRLREALACICLFLLAACGHGPADLEYDHLADGTVSLSHRSLHPVALHGDLVLASASIGDPRHLIVQGNHLWVADHSGNPFLHVIDLQTRQLISSRGHQGEGPGDFQENPQLTTRPGDDGAIWAYDANLRRLTREVMDTTAKYVTLPTPEHQVESMWAFKWLGRNRLVGIGDMDTNRLMFADTSGNMLAMVRSEFLGPDSASMPARRAASAGFTACTVPSSNHLAVVFQLGGRIDIHDSTGQLIAHAKVPFPSNGEWAVNPRGLLWLQPNWFYYLDCVGTPKYLYALFGGHRTDGPGKGQTRAARYVHVFDWQGNLVSVLGLDHEMSTIAMAGDSVLYGAGRETEGIYAYRVPALGTPQ